jgi:hypothetical protein
MKKIILLFCVLTIFSNCSNCSNSSTNGNGPGTLGSVETTELNCSISDVDIALDQAIQNENFQIPKDDSIIVGWWVVNGYDFLDSRCLNINNTYYMISLYSESTSSTSLGLRSFYDRHRKEWMFAVEFNSTV